MSLPRPLSSSPLSHTRFASRLCRVSHASGTPRNYGRNPILWGYRPAQTGVLLSQAKQSKDPMASNLQKCKRPPRTRRRPILHIAASPRRRVAASPSPPPFNGIIGIGHPCPSVYTPYARSWPPPTSPPNATPPSAARATPRSPKSYRD
jgi:hypothetical protein